MSSALDIENLLKQALTPVDPPADLQERVEATLSSFVDAAAEELEAWELSSMKDPRNWVRPATAVVVGAGSAAGLVVLRTRKRNKRHRQQATDPLDLLERTVRDLARETKRVLDRD